jgi:hypothetical protein
MKHRYVAAATALAGAGAAYALLARPWHLRWGATDQESCGPLPGDDLLASSVQRATCVHEVVGAASRRAR